MGKIRPPKNLNKLQEKVAFVIWEGERISVFPSSDSLLSGSIKEADRSPVPVGLVPLLLSHRQTDNLSTNYFPLSGNLERQCRIFRSLCVFIFIWSSSLDMSSSNTRNTMFRFRDYSEDGILFKYRAAAFIRIIIETFKNI